MRVEWCRESVSSVRARRESGWQQRDGGARCGGSCEWDSVCGSCSGRGREWVLLSEEHPVEREKAVLERLSLPSRACVACALSLVREPAGHLMRCDPTCSNKDCDKISQQKEREISSVIA